MFNQFVANLNKKISNFLVVYMKLSIIYLLFENTKLIKKKKKLLD